MTHSIYSDRPLLIGLIGRAGAGKDTVAAYLEREYAFERLGLADPILHMVLTLMDDAGQSMAYAVERPLKEQPMPIIGKSYRHLAQTLGTQWGREYIDPDVWVRIAEQRTRQCMDAGLSVAIADIRFPNEAQWVLRQGGHLVRVLRNAEPAMPEHTAQHVSEALWAALPAQHELHNHGSIATLEDQVDRLMHTLRTQQAAAA